MLGELPIRDLPLQEYNITKFVSLRTMQLYVSNLQQCQLLSELQQQ